MNHWDRLAAAIRGESVDCAPISLWRHWPQCDQDARALAKAVVTWQRRFDFDLARFMTSNTFVLEAWGARTLYQPNVIGTRAVTHFGVTDVEQWPRLARLDVNAGSVAIPNVALGMAAQALGGTVPLMQTVSSPFATARDLAGESVFEHMRSRPDLLEAGLGIIAETTAELAREALRSGASGIALATRCTGLDTLTEAEHERFVRAFDLRVLEAVRGSTQFSMLHIRGRNAMFDRISTYPVDMINWQDRAAGPDLRTARTRFAGLLVGGLDELGALIHGPVSEVEAMVADALAQTGGRRVMIACGDACALATPDEHIDAAVKAVRTSAETSEERCR